MIVLYSKLYLQCLMRGRDLVGVKILQQGKQFSDRHAFGSSG